MKVLLIGEFSGVHNNFKKGLQQLGVDVTLASTGDGFKKFKTDIMLIRPDSSYIWEKAANKLFEQYNYIRMKQYDVIQFINPASLYFIYSSEKIFELMDHAKLTVMNPCGCDSLFSRYYQTITPKLCENCLKYDKKMPRCWFKNSKYSKFENDFYNRIDIIIPNAWEYYKIIHDFSPKMKDKIKDLIPFPCDTDSIKPFYANRHRGKTIVYHPLNREGFKGTTEIRQAFEILKEKYKQEAAFIIKGRMPFDQYMKFVQNVDIVIDQPYCVTYGMGALNAMAQGKVVFAGNARNWKNELDQFDYLSKTPKFDLGNNINEMVENISFLLEHKDKIEEYGKLSRAYAVKYHNAKDIAARFLKLYKENI